jgi:hypothetical protein
MSKLDSSNKVETVYGGSGHDFFNGITTNINNDIICVGTTNSEGTGGRDILVVKFDPNLNVLVRNVYGSTKSDILYEVATDSNDDIICVGTTNSEGTGINTLLVKFSGSDLSIISKKVYDGTSADYFYGVATDANNDIICVGITASEEAGNNDVLVVKSVS